MKLGILSDAHGNAEAFQIAIDLLRRHGAERLVFLGDAVGYLPGCDVVDVLMARDDVLSVAGNHEQMLLSGDVPAELDAIYRLQQTRAAMTPAQFDFVSTWPTRRALQVASHELLFVHGSPNDETNGYVYPDTDLSAFTLSTGTAVFMGHTHRPFVRRSGDVTFVNVGSCGLPRDRGNLGAACLFDCDSGEAAILRFDITQATARALERCGPIHSAVREVMARRPKTPVVGASANA